MGSPRRGREVREVRQVRGEVRSSSPLSPARITRAQEKEELSNLNDRLAVYIDKMRSLEAENSMLRMRVSESEEVVTSEVTGIKASFERELADARLCLDNVAHEKARIEIESGKLRSDFNELYSRMAQKERDLATALGRNKDLEAQLGSKSHALGTALAQQRILEDELRSLKASLSSLEGNLLNLKKQLEEETLARVTAENAAQSLKEELEFRRSMFENEVKETRKRHESRLVEIDAGHQQEYESKLAQALQDLRAEHMDQVQLYKNELENNYKTKMENAKMSLQQNSTMSGVVQEELTESRMRIETLNNQLGALQRQVAGAEAKIRDLEETLRRERDSHWRQLADKDRELTEIRQAMTAQINEYEQLLEVKLALDMEISAYRKMLEGEEERLHLSPSPSSRVTVTRSSETVRTSGGGGGAVSRSASGAGSASAAGGAASSRSSVASSRVAVVRGGAAASGSNSGGLSLSSSAAKRKRLDVQESEATSSVSVTQRASASGVIAVDEIDAGGRFVKLINDSQQDQAVGGWTVKRSIHGHADIVYKFTGRTIVKAGDSITIWAGGAGVQHNPPRDLLMKQHSTWGSGDEVRVVVLNANGEEVAMRQILRRQGAAGEDDDEDEDVVEANEALFHQQEGAERGADSTEETISEYELRSRTVRHNTPGGGGDGGDGGGGNSSSRSSRAGSATRSRTTTARASAASQSGSRSGVPDEAILRLGIYSAGVGSPEPRGGIHVGGEAAVGAVRLSTGQQASGASVTNTTSVTTQRVETSQVPRGSLAAFLRR
ncbi:lamin-B2-like isoform X2 [Petromyzon marinus]|uniref:Lamin-B1-like isoform X2 n=1 Tax=Petromyzon marinus TaxID=7757 RepID=A0AAJ7WR87_PETMA|nr:lamin-B1-like isoform X2 [Petromyzon marinus]